MKKYGLRVFVGLIAFSIGFGSSLIWEFNQTIVEGRYIAQDNSKPEFSDFNYLNPNGKVEILFIGFGQIGKRPTLKFKISNNFSFPIYYRAEEEGKPEIFLKINGKEIVKRTGLFEIYEPDFILKENESLMLEVFADELFFRQLKEKGIFQFGFRYHLFNNSEYTTYNFGNYDREIWTEPVTISEKTKKDVYRNAPDLLKLGRKDADRIIRDPSFY